MERYYDHVGYITLNKSYNKCILFVLNLKIYKFSCKYKRRKIKK